jgi:hypothetical protein
MRIFGCQVFFIPYQTKLWQHNLIWVILCNDNNIDGVMASMLTSSVVDHWWCNGLHAHLKCEDHWFEPWVSMLTSSVVDHWFESRVSMLTSSVVDHWFESWVSMLTSSVVDHWFESRLSRTKDHQIGIWCFSTKQAVLKSKS